MSTVRCWCGASMVVLEHRVETLQCAVVKTAEGGYEKGRAIRIVESGHDPGMEPYLECIADPYHVRGRGIEHLNAGWRPTEPREVERT